MNTCNIRSATYALSARKPCLLALFIVPRNFSKAVFIKDRGNIPNSELYNRSKRRQRDCQLAVVGGDRSRSDEGLPDIRIDTRMP